MQKRYQRKQTIKLYHRQPELHTDPLFTAAICCHQINEARS